MASATTAEVPQSGGRRGDTCSRSRVSARRFRAWWRWTTSSSASSRGTVHALMGENGAGKSTLMKIIAGIYHPIAGTFNLRGQEIKLDSPSTRSRRHRHDPSGAQPDAVHDGGREHLDPPRALNRVRLRRSSRDAPAHDQELFERLDIDIDPETEVRDLSRRQRQMVEIAKAVSYESDILIMDEPTSALTETEVAHSSRSSAAARQGKGIVYITHKMNELFEIADEVSVFRDGKYRRRARRHDVTRDDIIRMMVGREITQMFPKEEVPIGEVVAHGREPQPRGMFHDISFELRKGEILGIAGLVGSGRSNVAETIFGVTPATSGDDRDRRQAGRDRLAGARRCDTAWRS